MLKVYFSWDDGSVYDNKISELFLKKGLKTTFFIPNHNSENKFLDKEAIKDLAQSEMVIGGHTRNHVYLNKISIEDVEEEIKSNKYYLEDICSKPVDIFCYPGGKYNKQIVDKTKLYFKKARTAETLFFKKDFDFNHHTTFHFYNRGLKSLVKNIFFNDTKYLPYILKHSNNEYFELIKNVVLDLKTQNLELNIWGHGWELENFNLFPKLDQLLDVLLENNIKILPFE